MTTTEEALLPLVLCDDDSLSDDSFVAGEVAKGSAGFFSTLLLLLIDDWDDCRFLRFLDSDEVLCGGGGSMGIGVVDADDVYGRRVELLALSVAEKLHFSNGFISVLDAFENVSHIWKGEPAVAVVEAAAAIGVLFDVNGFVLRNG